VAGSKLGKQAYENLMRFNKGQGNPQYQCRLRGEGIESNPVETLGGTAG